MLELPSSHGGVQNIKAVAQTLPAKIEVDAGEVALLELSSVKIDALQAVELLELSSEWGDRRRRLGSRGRAALISCPGGRGGSDEGRRGGHQGVLRVRRGAPPWRSGARPRRQGQG